MKSQELFRLYAKDSDLKTYHYKVLLLLLHHDLSQAEICAELGVSKQNLNKICRDLLSLGYISAGEIVGRNKYLKINPNPSVQVKGQMNIADL